MDYKEKYEQALERCKKEFNFNNLAYSHEEIKQKLERVFPELNDDERIKKEIIEYLEQSQFGEEHYQVDDDIVRGYIAWFEKQDPKKHEEELENAYKCADEVQYRKGYEDAKREFLKQDEQKPAWSEEDEKQARQIERIVHDDGCSQKLQKQIADWFKSLKDRYTWKPSDEQIKALEHFVRSVGESGYASPYDNNTKLLYLLLSDLKKLKG